MRKISAPHSILIETVATHLATTFYEVGRSQGMTSKCKNAKEYARKHLEKFIPRALDYLLDILHNPSTNNEMKEMVYDCLVERVNDPSNITSTDIKGLPALDIKKLLDNLPKALPNQQLKKVREKPLIIETPQHHHKPINVLNNSTAIGKVKG